MILKTREIILIIWKWIRKCIDWIRNNALDESQGNSWFGVAINDTIFCCIPSKNNQIYVCRLNHHIIILQHYVFYVYNVLDRPLKAWGCAEQLLQQSIYWSDISAIKVAWSLHLLKYQKLINKSPPAPSRESKPDFPQLNSIFH